MMGSGSGLTSSVGGLSHHSVGGGGCAKYGPCTNQLVSLERIFFCITVIVNYILVVNG